VSLQVSVALSKVGAKSEGKKYFNTKYKAAGILFHVNAVIQIKFKLQ
jgi:hypothetical protein